MNRFRPFILAATVIISALAAFGLFTMPRPRPADSDEFSAERAIRDIEVISKECHSVAHPKERAEVRDYLAARLEGMGAEVSLYEYDSIRGPKNKHVEYLFDAVDVVGVFPPEKDTADASYLMLVAHYDSRYSQPVLKDTVWSKGAADDGYGVATALETVNVLLKERKEWEHGVKVVFTDAEEAGMHGMYGLWNENREVFDNVGLVINIEARGPWGPALLFETSPGNGRLMELYAEAARYPYTYSLTTVVYGFMPNFTDFTVVKDSIPGFNFSTVADINHYHTDLDNFSNVSPRSVQHYGEQIVPVAKEYLTGEEWKDKDSLKGESDDTFFTIPAIGLIRLSGNYYMILTVIVAVVFLLLFIFEILRGRAKHVKAWKSAGFVFLSALAVLLTGELIAWCCAAAVGAVFKPFGIVAGIRFDNTAMIAATALTLIICIGVYVALRQKAIRHASVSMRSSATISATHNFAENTLLGVLLLDCILSVIGVFTLGENLMFFIPLFCCTASLLLYRITSLKLFLPVGMAVLLLHAFSFLYALAMALTIGAFGAVLMIAFFDIMALIPLCDLYLTPAKPAR
ncbi:MAG: M20/M25/M40 family metallo-hydrolase [Candidatus Cryptobacteroides sp.]